MVIVLISVKQKKTGENTTKTPDSEIEKLANQFFLQKIILELYSAQDVTSAVSKTLHDEYIDYISRLKTIFRTVCFATTPYSQLMWGGAYADFHNGFCIEYTVLPNDETCQRRNEIVGKRRRDFVVFRRGG